MEPRAFPPRERAFGLGFAFAMPLPLVAFVAGSGEVLYSAGVSGITLGDAIASSTLPWKICLRSPVGEVTTQNSAPGCSSSCLAIAR